MVDGWLNLRIQKATYKVYSNQLPCCSKVNYVFNSLISILKSGIIITPNNCINMPILIYSNTINIISTLGIFFNLLKVTEMLLLQPFASLPFSPPDEKKMKTNNVSI